MIGNTKSNKSKVKGSKYARTGVTYMLAAGIAVIVTVVNLSVAIDSRRTVSIIRVKEGEVLAKGATLSDNLCEEYGITKKDYTSDMLLYKDKDKYYGQYAANFIHGGNEIRKDEITDTRPVRNQWLYSIDDSMEVITIPYTPTELAGKLLTPGDHIKIRATYADPNGDGSAKVTEELSPDTEIVVRDMLNSANESIFDIYSELNKLSDSSRKKAIQSSEFSSAIQPVSIMIAVPTDVATYYTDLKNKYKATFTMTLLSRSGADANTLEDVPIVITSDVEAWVAEEDDSSSSQASDDIEESADKNNVK